MQAVRFIAFIVVGLTTTRPILFNNSYPAVAPSVTTNASEDQVEEWPLEILFGMPVRHASNSTITALHYSERVIFLLIDDGYYTVDNLRALFTGLAARYSEPHRLRIEVYSDSEMLRRAMARDKERDDLIFPDNAEGEELEKLIRGDLYIPKSGWSRARYYRGPSDGERFFFRPDVNKLESVQVTLRPRPVRNYTGDRQDDLFVACELGDIAKAKSLIETGAMVDHTNNDGETPLIEAVRNGKVGMVKLLLERGALVDARTKHNQTALTKAISNSQLEIAAILIKHGADLNARYGSGFTPLHLAAYKGDEKAMELLLNSGADPNARDEKGNTPLFDAVGSGKSTVVRALLYAGAKKDIENKLGKTPLTLAVELGYEEIARMLKSYQ